MVVTFKTFQSGLGDCIFLVLKQGDKQFSIMVDCGEFTEVIKHYVQNDLNNHIDLLVVTHIDSDHILGIETMLTTTRPTIGKILFNCYQRDPGQAPISLTLQQKQRLQGIQSEINSVFRDIIEQEVSAQQAIKDLSTAILKNWKSQWDRPFIALDAKNEESLGKWGTIKFLAPTMKQIKALDMEFKSILFSELFTEQDGIEYKNSESIYEILIRYANLHNKETIEEHETAAFDLEQTLTSAAEEPVNENSITTSNKASLAFVWEKGNSKVLFLGDAKPELVIKGLLKHYPVGPWPMHFDVIKVAHHGSHNNTTESLMDHIDSEHFFLTGGEEGVRPSEAALGRILLQPLKCGVTKRTLHVNFPTTLTNELKKDKALQKKYHFQVDYDQNKHEFTL